MSRLVNLRHRVVVVLLVTTLSAVPSLNVRLGLAQDDAATFAQLWADATEKEPTFGPENGELVLDITNLDYAPVALARLRVQDFAIHAEYEPPAEPDTATWSVGLHFRLGQEPHFRFYFSSEHRWWFLNGADRTISSGVLANTHVSNDTSQTIDLVAVGETGYVAVNDLFLTTLPLAASVGAGDISVSSASSVPDARTTYHDFTVWSLDPESLDQGSMQPVQGDAETLDAAILNAFLNLVDDAQPDFPPTDGETTMSTSTVASVAGLRDVQNVIVHVEFTSPYDPEPTNWDAGLFLRFGQTPYFRFIVESTGRWYLTYGSGDAIQSGNIADFNPDKGERVTIDLVAIDSIGYAAINGVYVGTLDLSAAVGPGSVDFGVLFFVENYVEGTVVPYRNFTVWSLD